MPLRSISADDIIGLLVLRIDNGYFVQRNALLFQRFYLHHDVRFFLQNVRVSFNDWYDRFLSIYEARMGGDDIFIELQFIQLFIRRCLLLLMVESALSSIACDER